MEPCTTKHACTSVGCVCGVGACGIQMRFKKSEMPPDYAR